MTELARTTTSPLGDRMTYAKALAEANLLPAAYRKQPANVLLAMEYGDALGLSPIAAIQGVNIIDGKPTASAQLIGALVRKAGHRLRVKVNTDGTAAKATIIRRDDPDFEFESVWTLERAQAAGLLGKGTWKQYPAAMLKSRAITEVARDACPEVLSGVAYTAEELGHDDLHVTVERVVTEVDDAWTTPEPAPAPARRGNRKQEPMTGPQRARLEKALAEANVVWDEQMVASAHRILGGLAEGWDGRMDTLDKTQATAIITSLEKFLEAADDVVDVELVDEQEQGDQYEAGH